MKKNPSIFLLGLALATPSVTQLRAADLFWDGTSSSASADGGNGTWDTSTTLNWDTLASGGTDAVWTSSNVANFGGTAGTVNVTAGTSAQQLKFATTGYILTGGSMDLTSASNDAVVVNSGITATVNNNLTKSQGEFWVRGGGTLVLGGTNTINPSFVLTGGSTLEFDNIAALGGTGGIFIAATVAGGGTIRYTGSTDATMPRLRDSTLQSLNNTFDITGTGKLTLATNLNNGAVGLNKTGNGTLILTGSNSYSGATVVSGGALTIALSGLGFNYYSSVITNNAAVTFSPTSNAAMYFNSALSGTGNFTVDGPGGGNIYENRVVLKGNATASDNTGQIDVINSGKLWLEGSNTVVAPSTVINLIGSTTSLTLHDGSIREIGALNGSGTVSRNSGTVVLSIGTGNSDSLFSGKITGALPITKVGNGRLTLTGANTFTGDLKVNNGAVQIGGADGTISYLALTIGNNSTSGKLILGDTSNAKNIKVSNLNSSGSGTANAIVAGGYATASTLTVDGTTYGNFSGILGGTGTNENNFNLVKTGIGTLTINGANTFTGKVSVNGGILGINNQTVTSLAAPASFTADQITMNGGALSNMTEASGLTAFNNGWNSTLAANIGITLGASGGTFRLGYSKTMTINGVITGSGQLVKADNGTLTLGAANTFNGTTTFSTGGGIIKLTNSDALKFSSVNTTNGSLTLNSLTGVSLGGLSGTGSTTQGSFTQTTGIFTLAGASDNSGLQAVVNGGTLELAKASNASVHAVGMTDAVGLTTGVSGTVRITGTGGDQIYSNTVVQNNGSFELNGNSEGFRGLTGTGTVRNNHASTLSTLTLGESITDTTAYSYDGVIENGDAAMLSLTKVGTGTQTLTNTNTYTGATTVNDGKLIINGSISNSSLTTVKTGATIGGSGTLGALTVENGGFVNPGNSPGILSAGNTNLNAGSNLGIEINGATVATEYDQLNVTGTVTLAGLLNVTMGYTPAPDALFFILSNNDIDAITGTFSNAATDLGFYNLGGQDFQISYTGNFGANAFTGGNDVVLKAIPETTSSLLGGLGALLLLIRRRR